MIKAVGKPNSDYESWPAVQDERRELARELFGYRLVAEYDVAVNEAY